MPNAQPAVRQGRLLARNLVATLRDRPPKDYVHHNLRVVATLGLGRGIFESHGIDTTALRNDDFETHLAHRREFLIGLIEAAMGNSVVREQGAVNVAVISTEYEEEAPDDDILEFDAEAEPEVA